MQQQFSSESEPTLQRQLISYEYSMSRWTAMSNEPRFAVLKPALEAGVELMRKYYNLTDKTDASIISMSKSFIILTGFYMLIGPINCV